MTAEQRRIRAALAALGLEPGGAELEPEIREAEDAAALLALTAAPLSPSAELKGRILASIADPSGLEGFVDRLAGLFELSAERMRAIVGLVIDPKTEWEAELPGVRLLHIDGGEALATADCGFVAMDPGAEFPEHRHLGREVSLILSGSAEMADGTVLRPGDLNPEAKDSSHHFRVFGDEPLLFAVFVHGGIEMLD